jgi:hypothetical protein
LMPYCSRALFAFSCGAAAPRMLAMEPAFGGSGVEEVLQG